MPSEQYKQRKVAYIKGYNQKHYKHYSMTFRADDPLEKAMLEYLRDKPSSNAYVKSLIIKDMRENGIELKTPKYSFTDDEYENMSEEQMDELIDEYFLRFNELPQVTYPSTIYCPFYMKLVINSLNNDKPYSIDDVKFGGDIE